jgi:dihydroorotate dehydrogenase electron transfer subunit
MPDKPGKRLNHLNIDHMYHEKAKILWNKRAGNEYYRIGLTCHRGYSGATPGQFIMLNFPGRMVPFLPRPFSIHRIIKTGNRTSGIELLYKVVGEGTKMLSGHGKGDVVNILGPLGNGFIFSNHYKRVFIVAGGIGVAPMLFLASYLKTKGTDPSECMVFLGGRSKNDLLCSDDFLRMGMKIHITTDDGSAGDQCFVTHPLETVLERDRPDIIYTCGPLEMLKCVAGIAEKHTVPCQVSIETVMACGMGACLGCAVERKEASGNYMHVCVDGPVFDVRCLKL